MPRLHQFFRLPPKLHRRARRRRMATLIALAALVFLVVLPFYVIYKPPTFVIRYFARRWPDVLWHVPLPADKKVIALTIDDAPSEHTRDILALLKEHGAKATFFVIGGQVAGREDILAEIVEQGHELGNHAMHDEAARGVMDEELHAQIDKVQKLIRGAYFMAGSDERGPKYNYFRPGSGFFSDHMRAMVDKMGFRLVLGSIYPHDAQISYWWLNARHILSMLRPGGIIICHDRRSWTIPMLAKVLPEAKRRGYKLVTVTDLLHEAGV
jgi:peptidoglycan/xylan/chitin deacetylase (PgdA/CDA1 family)